MQNFKRCGFFIIIIFLSYLEFAFSDEQVLSDLETIVITKSNVTLLEPYCVKADTLESLPFDSPIESLSILPLDLQSRTLKGSIQTDFSLRGSTFQGVIILVDGSRINDPQTAHHNSDIPITKEDIQKIEVLPGVGSSLFGSDAIGGAINIILKKPETKKRVLEFKAGQYQTGSGLFSITEKIDDLGLRLSLENQESNGFYDDTDFKKFTTSFNSSLDLPDGKFDLSLGYQEKEFGAYDFYTPKSNYLSKEWTKTYLLNTGFSLDKEGLLIKPNFLWRRHFDKFMLDKTQLRSRYLNHHQTDIYTPNIYFQKQSGIFGSVGLGLEYGQEQINSTNLGKHNRKHKSIFLDNSQDFFNNLAFGLALRFEDFSGFDKVYSGSLNLKCRINEKNYLYAGFGRSIRIPSFTELYYNDPTTVGDPNLTREKALNYQFGYDYKREKLSLAVTFFLRQEKDFIDWIKRTPTQAKWQVENITEAQVFGIENYLKLDINQSFSLDSNYTYINKRINDRGYLYKYGPNYIRHLINTTFILKLPFGVQSIGFTYKKKPSRDGWFLLNTHLSCNLNKDSQIFLNTSNLLNVEYQEIEGIPQPGRWVEIGIRFEW